MTTSYNVTISGITDQIKELVKRGKKDIGLDAASTDPLIASKIWYASRLIGCLIKDSVFEVVKSARDAQDILGTCSKNITGEGHIVRWVTPIGFEVVQAYKKFSTKRIKLFLSGIRMDLSIADRRKYSVNNSKSKAGLAPNFIHSLDACHLQMTVNGCSERAGLTSFAFIHDSFGTHASKTDLLMRILREEFVRLYSNDILRQTIAQWKEIYPEVTLPEIQEDTYGDLDVTCVKQSKFFFS
jgi:DNA-directed RNA polymerase, mitochondrial